MSNSRKRIWVSPAGDQWKVKSEDATRAAALYDRKADAVQRAAEMGRNNGHAQVFIQRADGTIQDERTYGSDPFPPRG